MSKRHQASRRKTYGRRQHEVREREERQRIEPDDRAFEIFVDDAPEDFGLFALGLGGRRFGFALSD